MHSLFTVDVGDRISHVLENYTHLKNKKKLKQVVLLQQFSLALVIYTEMTDFITIWQKNCKPTPALTMWNIGDICLFFR